MMDTMSSSIYDSLKYWVKVPGRSGRECHLAREGPLPALLAVGQLAIATVMWPTVDCYRFLFVNRMGLTLVLTSLLFTYRKWESFGVLIPLLPHEWIYMYVATYQFELQLYIRNDERKSPQTCSEIYLMLIHWFMHHSDRCIHFVLSPIYAHGKPLKQTMRCNLQVHEAQKCKLTHLEVTRLN